MPEGTPTRSMDFTLMSVSGKQQSTIQSVICGACPEEAIDVKKKKKKKKLSGGEMALCALWCTLLSHTKSHISKFLGLIFTQLMVGPKIHDDLP